MFRKDLIPLLLDRPLTIPQIAKLVGEKPKQIADDLGHLFRSLKHTEYRAVIEPAECRDCGFEFSETKITKPSKCPKCRSRWISDPTISIQNRA